MRWLGVAIDDVALALSSVVRPWTDLRAVKTTHVATVQALVNALSDDVVRLKSRETEQEATIRQLRSTVDALQRALNSGSPQAPDPRARLR
jgi:hypothetical protein